MASNQSAADVLKAVEAAERTRTNAVRDVYREVVRALAGEASAPSPDDVRAALAGAGKSAADLKADIAEFVRRKGLRAAVHRGDIARVESSDMWQQIREAQAEFKRTREEFEKNLGLLNSEVTARGFVIAAGEKAAADLDRTSDPQLAAQLAAAETVLEIAVRELALAIGNLQPLEKDAARSDIPEDVELYTDGGRRIRGRHPLAISAEQRLPAARAARDQADAARTAAKIEVERLRSAAREW